MKTKTRFCTTLRSGGRDADTHCRRDNEENMDGVEVLHQHLARQDTSMFTTSVDTASRGQIATSDGQTHHDTP